VEELRGAVRCGSAPVLLEEMRLEGGSDFIGCFKRMVDGLVPGSVVNHAANVSILRRAWPGLTEEVRR
jgi:hypothetical protein